MAPAARSRLPCSRAPRFRYRSPPMTLALHQYLQDLASHADLHGVLGVYADGAAVAEQACGHANPAGGRKNARTPAFASDP